MVEVTLISFVLTMIVTAASGRFMGLPWGTSLMMGAMLGGTAAAIVIPLVKQMKISEYARTILSLESAISAVLSMVVALAFMESYKRGSMSVSALLGTVFSSFLMALILGVVGGVLWASLLDRVRKLQNSMFLTPAFLFLAAKGYSVGASLVDNEKIDYCKDMMAKAEAKGVKLLLPVDTVVADSFPNPIDGEIAVETVMSDAIPEGKMGLDIGEKAQAEFAAAAKAAKTVVWNGPMGVFENPTLAKGTIAVAQALADSQAVTIVGGGDSAAACEQLGFADKITHISTGGGASLEFLEGLELPGIACLQDK